jgi:hypothetical protein
MAEECRRCNLIYALGNLVFEHPLLHPAHREQVVERREQTIPNSVMTFASEARIVADLDFHDCVALNLEQRRQKAVHAFEKF